VGLPLAVRVLLVLVHLRTNLTTRALAVLFATSQSGPIGSSATWYRYRAQRFDRNTAPTPHRGSSTPP
jgi:hypothetical protein